jgi:hypothetical protein
MAKKTYRVRNWSNYNKSLVQRGSITFWFSPEVVDPSGLSHGNQRYSDMMILCALTLRQLYRLPLRATQGLMASLIELAKLEGEAPDYTTLCRRGKTLKVDLGVVKTSQPLNVLIDSTGIKVMGEGEWKMRCHGKTRRRLWRKLHIAMDLKTQMILSATMTESARLDGNYLPVLMDQIEGQIDRMIGDGAYDKKVCYQCAYEREAQPIFPPQHDAIVQRNKIKKDPALLARDRTIEFIGDGDERSERRKLWKEINHYHDRSLVETMMLRMKTLFGDEMRSRTFENQYTDLMIRCAAINRINTLGLPISEAIND